MDRITWTAGQTGSLVDLRDSALLRVASDGLLRISELAGLRVEDIGGPDEDGAGTITLRSLKTDQEDRGEALYLGPDTMAAVRAWITAAGIKEGALFLRIAKGGRSLHGRVPLTIRGIRHIIKRRGASIGIERASGHSLRGGAAQSLAGAGVLWSCQP